MFTFRGVRELQGPNYGAAQGLVEVTRDGKPVATMQPEKRIYSVQQNPMTEAAIDTGFTRDLYVSLGEPVPATARGSCACTTSRSSTGSGAAAC